MGDGIERGHARQPVCEGTGDGQSQIDVPQRFGGLGDAGCEFGVLHRAGGFGAIELHASDAQHGQDRNRQDDDAHTPQPLQLRAIVEDSVRQAVQTEQHRGAGGGQAGYGLEYRVGEAHVRMLRQHKGDGSGHSQHRPEHGYHYETVAHAQLVAKLAHRQPKYKAGGKNQGKAQ